MAGGDRAPRAAGGPGDGQWQVASWDRTPLATGRRPGPGWSLPSARERVAAPAPPRAPRLPARPHPGPARCLGSRTSRGEAAGGGGRPGAVGVSLEGREAGQVAHSLTVSPQPVLCLEPQQPECTLPGLILAREPPQDGGWRKPLPRSEGFCLPFLPPR